ncbi:MAG: hypothetical protein LAO21_11540 [Acidobacteriia bacterium]|nr:hypothetical protein [Terriglobia bacterium]
MRVTVHWKSLKEGDDGWGQIRCLYAVLGRGKEILYIGKCWGKTVRERWTRSGKPDFWDEIEQERGIKKHALLVGTVEMDRSRRLTHWLLMDIESLLIICEQPWGNRQSKKSRIPRPGLIVKCVGTWPSKTKTYRDI